MEEVALSKILRANHNPPERNDLSPKPANYHNLAFAPFHYLQLTLSAPISLTLSTMAAPRSVARLVAYRRPTPFGLLGSTANFSSSTIRAATPVGPPQAGFRLAPPKRWDQGDESALDKASKYFLMAEIFRGMYVVLEQFFRPP